MPLLQQQSALDTLAEVSRHYSSQRSTTESGNDSSASAFNDTIAEQALLSELRGHADLKSPAYPLPPTSSRQHTVEKVPQPTHRSSKATFVQGTTLAASPLVQTASAANHQLELQRRGKSAIDPFLSESHRQIQPRIQHSSTTSGSNHDGHTHLTSWRSVTSPLNSPAFAHSAKLSNEPTAGLLVSERPNQAKKRGRFDDSRRKQVSDIRKRGACIRCRMLKKPCSGETPCSTCRTVESARLWKGTCLRTRLAEEFTLYSTNLFHARAKIDVAAAIQGLAQMPTLGRVDVRFQPGSNSCMSFGLKAYARNVDEVTGGQNQNPADDRSASDHLWILDESDSTVMDTLANYVNQAVDLFIANEQSTFVRATLQQAQELLKNEESEKAIKTPSETEKRSSYNLQHELLKNLIELWILTKVLTSPSCISLKLQYHRDGASQPQNPHGESAIQERDVTTHEIPNSSKSYYMMQTQLLAAVEARCRKVSRATINELERRLLQRQQVSRFGTFLASALLLCCAERMCGLYYSFDNNKEHLNRRNPLIASNLNEAEGNTPIHDNDRPESWPLDRPPLDLWSQGQSFSDLLLMLLRMRALPPLTGQRLDGTLGPSREFSGGDSHGQPTIDRNDRSTSAGAWLESLNLNAAELALARDVEPPADGGAEAWDMKLVSKLLLPESA